jgi:hypothetical protein
MKYTVELGSGGMIYALSFMKIGLGVEWILRFYISDLKNYNVGITDERDLQKYAFETGSDGMIYISSFIRIG